MRLARKLAVAIIFAICLVLFASGLLRIRHDTQTFEEDMRRDHAVVADAMGRAIGEAVRRHGREEALTRMERFNARDGRVRVRWLEVATSPPRGARDGRFYTYVPVPADEQVGGIIEVSESLDDERAAVRDSAIRALGAAVVLAAIAAVIASLVGFHLVGVPIRLLAAKARRVGAGDLDGPIQLKQADELGELAREMNMMCERLSASYKRLEAETQARIEAIEALRHADRLATVGKLASGIAHELGTPLNVIAARAKMIADREGTPAEQTDYARIIAAQADRITRIIRQLLDFARGRRKTGQETNPLDRTPVELDRLAVDTCGLLKTLADKQRVTLSMGPDARGGSPGVATPPRALADANAIQQALTNLVVNAIQATPAGGSVEVTVDQVMARPPLDATSSEAPYVRLAVRDEGSGIEADNLQRLFEPFFTTKDVGEGTGLGLSVSYGIVREHAGWIAVESQVGQGSCFSIYLPRLAPG